MVYIYIYGLVVYMTDRLYHIRWFIHIYIYICYQCIYIWHPQSNLMKLKMVDFGGGCHIYIYIIYIYIICYIDP